MTRTPPATSPRTAQLLWALLVLSLGFWLAHPVVHAGEAGHGASHHCTLCISGASDLPAPAVTAPAPQFSGITVMPPASDAPRAALSFSKSSPRAPPKARSIV